MWESSGWMRAQDPYGWFQWYCRFYQGRRSEDDERQVSRWEKCAGLRGRFGRHLSTCLPITCPPVSLSPVHLFPYHLSTCHQPPVTHHLSSVQVEEQPVLEDPEG